MTGRSVAARTRRLLGEARGRLAGAVRAVPILLARKPAGSHPRVWYGHDALPALTEASHGGIVKFQYLALTYPNTPRGFNLLYMVSSQPPRGASVIARAAKLRGARIVWNQNGVAYPGWHGPGWERTNAAMAELMGLADHVFFQSEFCRLGAERFLGTPSSPSEILHNPVDTERFVPATTPPPGLVLLLGGNQYQRYRLESALRALAIVRRVCDARLVVTGRIQVNGPRHSLAEGHRMAAELGVDGAVEFTGPYTQSEAPGVFQRAHVLLHTKYNDPCPGIVLEALASGLPVVYSASGGVPELVGSEAGIGVPSDLSWERDTPPDPDALASAVLAVVADLPRLAHAARTRAVLRFALPAWVKRHRDVFESLL